jgi:hypothetical protein
MPVITENPATFTESRISVDNGIYSVIITNYSNLQLEVNKEEEADAITIPAYAIGSIEVKPNMHLRVRKLNIDPNALILNPMRIYYSQNSAKTVDSIRPLASMPGYTMNTNIVNAPNIRIFEGQNYCVSNNQPITQYSNVTQIMFMAQNPLLPLTSQPAEEFVKSIKVNGFMLYMPTHWNHGANLSEYDTIFIGIQIDFCQLNNPIDTPYIFPMSSAYLYYSYDSNGNLDTNNYAPIHYQLLNYPTIANCIIVTLTSNVYPVNNLPYQIAIDNKAEQQRKNVILGGRRELGAYGSDTIQLTQTFNSAVTNNEIQLYNVFPWDVLLHLTYAEDGIEGTGTCSLLAVRAKFSDTSKMRYFMKQLNPAINTYKSYPLDIWLPANTTLYAVTTVTAPPVTRNLTIFVEAWRLENPYYHRDYDF